MEKNISFISTLIYKNNLSLQIERIKIYSIISVFFFTLNSVTILFPEMTAIFFSLPAAKTSSLFLGTPCIETEPMTYTLPHPVMTVHVVPSCSGYSFWTILISFFLFRVLQKYHYKKAMKYASIFIPASYIISIILNAFRITAAFYTSIIAQNFMNAKYAQVLHLWLGILIFFPALILINIIFERSFQHEK